MLIHYQDVCADVRSLIFSIKSFPTWDDLKLELLHRHCLSIVEVCTFKLVLAASLLRMGHLVVSANRTIFIGVKIIYICQMG